MLTFRASFRKFGFPRPSFSLSLARSNSRAPSYKSALSDLLDHQRLDEARVLLDRLHVRDVTLCTMMINGYARNGRIGEALKLFEEMPERDVVAWNSMIKGSLDCGGLGLAVKLFDEMPERSVVSWTTMVNGLLHFGRVDMAECLFREMPVRDAAAWNSMIYGYCSYGRAEDGVRLFEEMPCRNVISWTSMISGLDQNGKTNEALSLFIKMVGSGVVPTSTTFACVLTACANIAARDLGIQIHGRIIKSGCCFDEFISASLITFYANCKEIKDAAKVFVEVKYKNVVVWTALITGYGSNCKHEDAMKVFGDMIKIGVLPNQSSLTSALNSCCGFESLEWGKEVHTVAIKLGLETDVFVGNSIVIMYTKCGNINDGIAIFKRIHEKNVVSWNAIIVGCAQHGCGFWTLTLFNQMIRSGVDPDEITFTGLLSACSHSGMLQKGRCFFRYFSQNKQIEVKLEHYACMVDVLGRCGKLEEAEEFIINMPIKANSLVWLALLSACRMHSNLDVAERAAKCVFDLEPQCSAGYVLLSNIYASANRWDEVSRIRQKMKHSGVVKQPGSSWVILKGRRHEFLSGDRSHPLSEKIYKKLDWLAGKMKDFGYVPDQRFTLHDVEAEQREEMLLYHSERLAIGFGLISTVDGSTITIIKNLRVCGDCHSAIKLIAKIVGREIIVRDSSRFHHFRNGICSCGDHW